MLEKTSQRYVKLQMQNSNLISDTNFSVNRKQLADNIANNFYIKKNYYINKIKLSANDSQPKT